MGFVDGVWGVGVQDKSLQNADRLTCTYTILHPAALFQIFWPLRSCSGPSLNSGTLSCRLRVQGMDG